MIRKLIFKIIEKALNYNRYEQKGKVKVNGLIKGLQNVKFEGGNLVANNCNFSGQIKIGKNSTLGYNSTIHGKVTIGKYCQLGPYLSIITTNHPTEYLSIYVNKQLFNGELLKLKTNKKTIIGNDVWVGQNVSVLGGVSIGNGAVIAAGSVVTKDVPKYSIVAGVPAKIIKMRFKDSTIEEIEKLSWWDMSNTELEKIKPLFFKNLNKTEIN